MKPETDPLPFETAFTEGITDGAGATTDDTTVVMTCRSNPDDDESPEDHRSSWARPRCDRNRSASQRRGNPPTHLSRHRHREEVNRRSRSQGNPSIYGDPGTDARRRHRYPSHVGCRRTAPTGNGKPGNAPQPSTRHRRRDIPQTPREPTHRSAARLDPVRFSRENRTAQAWSGNDTNT